MSNRFPELMQLVRDQGLLQALVCVFDAMRLALAERAERFDERFGTATNGKVYHPQRATALTSKRIEAHPYEATPAWLIRGILNSLPVEQRGFVFLDLGAGKGRALMVASEFRFLKLVGVEISSHLCRVATSNLNRYLGVTGSETPYEIYCMDAAEYDFEHAPLVVFLFNPFGKATFQRVLSRLESSL